MRSNSLFDHALHHLGWVPADSDVHRYLRAWDPGGFKKNDSNFWVPTKKKIPPKSPWTRSSLFIFMLTPHFVVIAPIFYSISRFRMQFADFYHFVGPSRSDSLGIIPCRQIKVGLVKSWRRPIPCRSAPDSCFDLRSHAGRAFKPFVQQRPLDRDRHCQFFSILWFPWIFLFRFLAFCTHAAHSWFHGLIPHPWLDPACNLLMFTITSVAVIRSASSLAE
jgi:hypothetical protein